MKIFRPFSSHPSLTVQKLLLFILNSLKVYKYDLTSPLACILNKWLLTYLVSERFLFQKRMFYSFILIYNCYTIFSGLLVVESSRPAFSSSPMTSTEFMGFSCFRRTGSDSFIGMVVSASGDLGFSVSTLDLWITSFLCEVSGVGQGLNSLGISIPAARNGSVSTSILPFSA